MDNCWEIKNCGLEQGGSRAAECGACPAAEGGFGHSCWAIVGTLCDGHSVGTYAQKLASCSQCEVYQLYNRPAGTSGKLVKLLYPEEHARYIEILRKRLVRPQATAPGNRCQDLPP